MDSDVNRTEEEPQIQNKNYKKKFRFCLVIILVLSFMLYGQWVSRTNMYIDARTNLHMNVGLYKFHIETYLSSGDIQHLYSADSYSLPITVGSNIFSFYYRNRLGDDLNRNFRKIFDRSAFYVPEATTEELTQKVEDVERIIEVIFQEPLTWRFATRGSLIPINPYSKKKTRALLEVTDEIVSSELEHKN